MQEGVLSRQWCSLSGPSRTDDSCSPEGPVVSKKSEKRHGTYVVLDEVVPLNHSWFHLDHG